MRSQRRTGCAQINESLHRLEYTLAWVFQIASDRHVRGAPERTHC
jgi:hypothetical protein